MISHLFDAFSKGILIFQKCSYVPENYALKFGYSPYFQFEIQFLIPHFFVTKPIQTNASRNALLHSHPLSFGIFGIASLIILLIFSTFSLMVFETASTLTGWSFHTS